MGLAIIHTGEVPRNIELHLACDMPRCRNTQKFVTLNTIKGFIEIYSEAMSAGWLERFRDRVPENRMFLCPSCSGKEPKNGNPQESPQGQLI